MFPLCVGSTLFGQTRNSDSCKITATGWNVPRVADLLGGLNTQPDILGHDGAAIGIIQPSLNSSEHLVHSPQNLLTSIFHGRFFSFPLMKWLW